MKRGVISIVGLLLLFSCRDNDSITTKSSLTQAYGLGSNETKSVSNDRSFSWYMDQGYSGQYALVNCGPTSVTMAITWANPSFTATPQDARAKYKPEGGWWYTSDIISYLSDNAVSNQTISLPDISLLRNELDDGNILILCLDMYYVNAESNPSYHVDKFYGAATKGWGHFIVVKGYKIVDGQVFYETYDPYSFGVIYPDNSIKGKDRYYREMNIYNATKNWWGFAIVVQSTAGGSVPKKHPTAVNPERIQHKSGQ